MIVSVDRDKGRVMVLADALPVPMVREDGAWRVDTFSADDLKDNFERASSSEAEALFHEARAAFSADPKRFMAEFKGELYRNRLVTILLSLRLILKQNILAKMANLFILPKH